MVNAAKSLTRRAILRSASESVEEGDEDEMVVLIDPVGEGGNNSAPIVDTGAVLGLAFELSLELSLFINFLAPVETLLPNNRPDKAANPPTPEPAETSVINVDDDDDVGIKEGVEADAKDLSDNNPPVNFDSSKTRIELLPTNRLSIDLVIEVIHASASS